MKEQATESAAERGWAEHAQAIRRAGRIVVKVGTSTLTEPGGRFHLERMERLVAQISRAADEGREMVLVTSGAIGAGMNRLGMRTRPRTIPEKQAVAAIGQSRLMQVYEELFQKRGRAVGQLLLTREDLTHRKRHLNSRNTLIELWRLGAIPIVNENDTVAVEEIRFGDNDTLAALVASLLGADLLIVLSDVDGVYDRNPQVDPDANRLRVVERITPELERAAGGPGTIFGSGGMGTKIQAARIATAGGTAAVIAHGAKEGVIERILAGEEEGTLFVPRPEKMAGRKRWIAFHRPASGRITVDAGAVRALVDHGKSLLPIGILSVSGSFDEGDVVQVVDAQGRELARGVVNYAADEVEKIKGCSTGEIEARLGYKYLDEVIHRDNLALSM